NPGAEGRRAKGQNDQYRTGLTFWGAKKKVISQNRSQIRLKSCRYTNELGAY
ncbi:MAG: hypothetical protein ACJA13_003248, partial [Paraglaciecola sp.]